MLAGNVLSTVDNFRGLTMRSCFVYFSVHPLQVTDLFLPKATEKNNVFKVDIQLPWCLHDIHGRYPLAPEHNQNFNLLILSIDLNEPRHEKTCLWEFPTRSDSNWPAQLQKLA